MKFVSSITMSAALVVLGSVLDSATAIPSSEIPRVTSYNNETDDCGRPEYPPEFLSECTDPLVDGPGVPDAAGWWIATDQTRIAYRVEQCGLRYTTIATTYDYIGRWAVRDYLRADGSDAGILRDFANENFPDCVPRPELTSTYQDNCHVIEDVNNIVTRCLIDKDTMVWTTNFTDPSTGFNIGFQETLTRSPNPRISTALINVTGSDRIGEFPTDEIVNEASFFGVNVGLGDTIHLCELDGSVLTLLAGAPGATAVTFTVKDSSGNSLFMQTDMEEPFTLGGGSVLLTMEGSYTLVVAPSPGYEPVERDFFVVACGEDAEAFGEVYSGAEPTQTGAPFFDDLPDGGTPPGGMPPGGMPPGGVPPGIPCEVLPFYFVVWNAETDESVGPLQGPIDLCMYPGGFSIELVVPCGNADKVKFILSDMMGERVLKTTEGNAPYQLGGDIDSGYDVKPVDQFTDYPGMYALEATISLTGGGKETVSVPVMVLGCP